MIIRFIDPGGTAKSLFVGALSRDQHAQQQTCACHAGALSVSIILRVHLEPGAPAPVADEHGRDAARLPPAGSGPELAEGRGSPGRFALPERVVPPRFATKAYESTSIRCVR